MIEARVPQRDFEGMEARRRQAAKLFAKGVCQADVARELEVSRQSVSRWYEAWSRGGVKELKGAGRTGRQPLLSSADLASVVKALRRGPRASGFATDVWTLPRITEVIATLTGVSYHPGLVWRIIGQLCWSPNDQRGEYSSATTPLTSGSPLAGPRWLVLNDCFISELPDFEEVP